MTEDKAREIAAWCDQHFRPKKSEIMQLTNGSWIVKVYSSTLVPRNGQLVLTIEGDFVDNMEEARTLLGY